MSARTSCAVGLALFTGGVGIHCAPPADDTPPAALSILAVGDTGKPHPWPAFLRSGQMRVARGMNAEDVRSPAGTLLLLGDNFYPEGLTEPELVARLRENLATPYCRFLELAGPRSAALADLCPEPAVAGERRILAVLGNHDIVAESSAALQRDAIPEFVSNWRLLDGCAGSVELGHGVSLVMADSTNECRPHGWEALADALRAARGPWRILAAHHPVNVADGGAPSPGGGFTKIVNRAIDESGVEVQLALSGHQHNLQILEQPSRGVALAVIAGSGAKSKAIRNPHPARRFAADELGFARVDLVDGDAGPRLVVSLFATPRLALLPSVLGAGPELRARWSVSLAGEVRDEG